MSERANKIIYMALSLAFAIAFWLYVDNVEGNTITKEFVGVPVEFIGETDTLPSRGLMLTEGGDTTIDIELRGPRSVITGLNRSDLGIQVDLTNITAVGTYPLTYRLLTPDNINSSAVSIEKASVSTVTVRIIEMYEKTIPVSVYVVGEVAENHIYMGEKFVAQPSVITISGREEDVDLVTEARIKIDLTDASSTVKREMEYTLRDKDGNIVENSEIRRSNKRVQVIVPVYEIKTLPLVVNFSEAPGSTEDNIDWELSIDSIEVAGEASSLSGKDCIELDVVDLSDLLSDSEIELPIILPAGCVNLSGATETTLSIKFKNVETRAFTVTDISAVGLGDNQTFSKVTNSVDVVVRGPAYILELLTPENIRIIVDMSPYVFNGVYSVPATVLIDGFSQVGVVGSYFIACKIS